MNISLFRFILSLLSAALMLSACSVAKLEARLEANPQCKDVVNPKTGALMPCPGSDKAFYREVGLAPAKPVAAVTSAPTSQSTPQASSSSPKAEAATPAKSVATQSDCKPQIHKKTGGILPCPAPD